jgi:hypothetical protein
MFLSIVPIRGPFSRNVCGLKPANKCLVSSGNSFLSSMAVPKLRRLVAGYPSRRPEFGTRSGHVEFVDKAALAQSFSEYFSFPCSSFHRLLHTQNLSFSPSTSVSPVHHSIDCSTHRIYHPLRVLQFPLFIIPSTAPHAESIILSEYFSFRCSSFNRLLHTQNLSSSPSTSVSPVHHSIDCSTRRIYHPLRVLQFPLFIIPSTAPHAESIIRGWYNRPTYQVDCLAPPQETNTNFPDQMQL